MKLGLAEFLKRNAAGNRRLAELRSPSAELLFAGEIGEDTAAELQSLCDDDARTMAGKGLTYVLHCKSEDGKSVSQMKIVCDGGQEKSDDGLPAPHTIRNAEAALGHLVRMGIEKDRALMQLAKAVADAHSAEVRETRIMVAKYARMQGKRADQEIALKVLEKEEAADARKGDALRETVRQLGPAVAPALAGLLARVVPSGPTTLGAVDQFFATFTDAQAEQAFGIIGPSRASKLLRARGPNAATEIGAVLGTLNDEEFGKLLAILRPEQVQALQGAMGAADKAMSESAPPSKTANGVAS